MVEKTIEALLPEGRFVPSESFRKLAHFRDKRVYDEAARHPEAFWASIARDRPHPQSGHEVAAGEFLSPVREVTVVNPFVARFTLR